MNIETLPRDIHVLLETGQPSHPDPGSILKEFGERLTETLTRRVSPEKHVSYLRPSNLGSHCDKMLWLKINRPELSESMRGETLLKFLIGDIWEDLLLTLAKLSGHDVSYEQGEAAMHGLAGKIDAKIDGSLIDVKSASTFSFHKFAKGLTPDTDAFGYLTQLGFYEEALKDELTGKSGFLAVDKTHGKLTLDFPDLPEKDWSSFVKAKQDMVAGEMPRKGHKPVPDGKSGNQKLCVECSYCSFKQTCWPNLRTFLYSSGPRYLTTTVREPDVTEIFNDATAV